MRLFALDLTATDTAQLTGLTRKSVTVIFLKIRGRIAEECERRSPLSVGQVEVDEPYFGARRVRGKRGRGASGKTIVCGEGTLEEIYRVIARTARSRELSRTWRATVRRTLQETAVRVGRGRWREPTEGELPGAAA